MNPDTLDCFNKFFQKGLDMSKIKKVLKDLGFYDKGIYRDYIFIIIGSFIMALGISVFLVNAKVVPGGVTGLAMAIHYLSGNQLPVGLMLWIFNIPLFIWGVIELGKQFGVRTFVGFTLSSFFIDLLRGRVPGLHHIRLHENPMVLSMMEKDFLLLVVAGGVLLGVGLGIIFKFKGTTAGVDVIAAIARKRWGIKPGQAFMIIDSMVITLAGIIIHTKNLAGDRPALTLVFYAFLLVFVSARIVDVIIEGFDYASSAMIISSQPGKISKVITDDLDRGGTALTGRGLYTNQQREVLYTVLSTKEIRGLVDQVKAIDPQAFIIVNNVHEVLGEGFRLRV